MRDRYKAGDLCIPCTSTLLLVFRPLNSPMELEPHISSPSLGTKRTPGSVKLVEGLRVASHRPFRQLVEGMRSQSIVISGERGTGKTLVTSAILQELGRLFETRPDKRVLQSIRPCRYVMRAFGSASTAAHNDSSRCSSLFAVQLNSNGRIVRVALAMSMLEAERLYERSSGEGAFHVLRLACRTFSDVVVSEAEDKFDLTERASVKLPDEMSTASFNSAMLEGLGIEPDQTQQLWQLLRGLLLLGNARIGVKDYGAGWGGPSEQTHKKAASVEAAAQVRRGSAAKLGALPRSCL